MVIWHVSDRCVNHRSYLTWILLFLFKIEMTDFNDFNGAPKGTWTKKKKLLMHTRKYFVHTRYFHVFWSTYSLVYNL